MKKGELRLIFLLIIFAVFAALLTVVFWPFIQDLNNSGYREELTARVKSLRFWGVVVLLGIQILQIIVAVIPGGPVQIIAGMAYGTWGGLAVLLTGCVLTTTAVFFTVRKLGLPLLKRFFGEEDINAWKFLQDSRKVSRFVFILFLVPGTPKDLLTWLTPLANISLPAFIVLSTLARIPAMLTSTLMGDAVIQGKWILSIALFAGIALIGFWGMRLKNKVTGFVNTP